jgi:uncharacterized protein (DUF4415 family)
MTREGQFSKAGRNGRASANRASAMRTTKSVSGAAAVTGRGSGRIVRRAKPAWMGRRKKPKGPNVTASVAARGRSGVSIANPEFYRPLKKPITLRLDADVLAWFKKDGRRYQTRINKALRQVMEREMRSGK